MTIAVFLFSLLGCMAIGMPVAYSLLLCGVALMYHLDIFDAGIIAAGGIIGPIIPPSIGFIVFGVAAGLSISKLFLAGIVPGILIGVGLAVAWWWVSRRENIQPPPKKTAKELFRTLIDGIWALMLPAI